MSANFTLNLRADAISRTMDQAIQKALKDLSEDVVIMAKSLAPVDTGELRRSIHATDVILGDEGWQVEIVADAVADRAPEGYSFFVELGTSRTPAQPFMTPAAEFHAGSLSQRIADHYSAMDQTGN